MTRRVERLEPAEWIGEEVTVVIDRPAGSTHPDGWFRYPVNYGHLPDVVAADGDGVDCYVLGTSEPLESVNATVVAVIERCDDIEDKLVVAVAGTWDTVSVAAAVEFCEQFFDSIVHMGAGSADAGSGPGPRPVRLSQRDGKVAETSKQEAVVEGDVAGR